MTAAGLHEVVRQLRGVLARRETAGLTDGELWQRWVRERDEAALEVLVRKHGPMVLGVCRRILHHEQDAEDAFQATFLVLVRKTGSLRTPDRLGNWLHGVAHRTALAARALAGRRRAVEAAFVPRTEMASDPSADLRPILDEELGRLPANYRIAVVLCDLEGKTRKEVARQLGWAEGTVASRVARGRSILARRLARRGFGGALVTAALMAEAATASVPSAVVVSTVTAASLMAARTAAAPGALAGAVATLTEGVLQSMLLTKVKNTAAVLLLITLATLSAGALLARSAATEPAAPAANGQAQQQAKQADVRARVAELKQQLQQIQRKIASLEEETAARPAGCKGHALLATLLKYRIRIEVGFTQTREGGRIEIQEVWGTRPRIEVGGQYLVRGKYVLPAGQRGKLYFYETATGAWGQGPTPTLDLQAVTLDKEKGEFTVLHGMAGPGYFHLYLAEPERYSHYFANVYFGTGENVLRKEP
jgi:RNA polymerase sigma factor (sigma-70 family)